MRNRLLLTCLTIGFAASLFAEDWPTFRGAQRTGVSSEAGLLAKWPDAGPPLRWAYKNAGLGFSSVSVVAGVVYTLGTRQEDEIVIALDLESGKELWTAKIGPIFTFKGNTWGDGPRSNPTIDGKLLFALGGQGDLLCVDVASKQEVWRKNLIRDFGGVMMTEWGYSESPTVDGDLLIVTPGGAKGTLLALNKTTGAKVWQSEGLTHSAPYTSVVIADIHKAKQYVQMSYLAGKGVFVNGFEPKTGKVLWTHQAFEGDSYNVATTPIVENNSVYYSTGNGLGSGRIEIGADHKVEPSKYTGKAVKAMKNGHGGVVKLGDQLWGHSENSMWVCQDWTTGKSLLADRAQLPATSGAITAAQGMLYLVTDSGEVALVKADVGNGKNLDVVSQFKLPFASNFPKMRPTSQASKVWAHPVVSNGCLFVRDSEFVMCFKIK